MFASEDTQMVSKLHFTGHNIRVLGDCVFAAKVNHDFHRKNHCIDLKE